MLHILLLLLGVALSISMMVWYYKLMSFYSAGDSTAFKKETELMVGGVSSTISTIVFALAIVGSVVKLPKTLVGLLSTSILLVSIALFVAAYYIQAYVNSNPGLLDDIQKEIDYISKYNPSDPNLNELKAYLSFYRYGTTFTAVSGVSGILSLVLKHGLKL